MDELRRHLGAWLRQQSDLGMPDPIFEPGFVGSAALFTSSVVVPAKAAAPLRQSPANAPIRAAIPSAVAAPFSAVRTKRAAPAGDFAPVDLAPAVTSAALMPAVASPRREELKKLYFATRDCRDCELCQSRRSVIFGSGSADAKVMIVGEAPDADEDTQGIPFAGRTEKLLADMLSAIHLDRKQDVFITNIVKCRPPGDRNPHSAEVTACGSILAQQIAIIRPRFFLLLGRMAAHTMLKTTEPLGTLRTHEHLVDGVPALVTYHPAALLRSAEYKRPAWEDLQKLENLLKTI